MLLANPAVERAKAALKVTEDEAAREALTGLLAAFRQVENQCAYLRAGGKPDPAPWEVPNPGIEVAEVLAAQEDDGDGDRLLTVKEAGEILGVEDRWLYDRSDALPFARKLAPRTLRFSERGLYRWLETRRP